MKHALPLPALCLGPTVALCAGANAADAGTLPKRVRLAVWGRNVARGLGADGADAEFFVNETTVAALPGNQGKLGFDLVTLDFEHQSHKGHANARSAPFHTAGQGRIEVVAGEGVFYVAEKYTPKGEEFAASYPDVSGVFLTNRRGEVVAVSSVALTQYGAVPGAAFAEAELAAMAASMTGLRGMELGSAETLTELVRELLGMDEGAEEKDLAAKLAELLRTRQAGADARAMAKPETISSAAAAAQPQSNPNQKQTMDPETKKTLDEVTATLKTLTELQKSQGEALTTITASLTATNAKAALDAHNGAVEGVIAAAIKEGKVIPASLKAKDDAGRYVMGAEAVKDVLTAIPATVATEFQGGTAKPATAADSAVEAEIMATLGISSERWKQGGLKQADAPASVAAALVS